MHQPGLHASRVVLLALLLGFGACAAAAGRAGVAHPPALAGAGVGESAAAAAARSATGGKVVGVRRSGDVYEVTVLLANGQVQVVRVDAASGRVVGG